MRKLYASYLFYQIGLLLVIYGLAIYILQFSSCINQNQFIAERLLFSFVLVLVSFVVFIRLTHRWPEYPGFVYMGVGMLLMISQGVLMLFGLNQNDKCLLYEGFFVVANGVSALLVLGILAHKVLKNNLL